MCSTLVLFQPPKASSLRRNTSFEPWSAKISPAVRPGRVPDKKGQDKTGQSKNSNMRYISPRPTWGKAPLNRFLQKFAQQDPVTVPARCNHMYKVKSFELKFSWVTVLHWVKISIFLLILVWALFQQCNTNALPVIKWILDDHIHYFWCIYNEWVTEWVSVYGLTSHWTHNRSFRRRVFPGTGTEKYLQWTKCDYELAK